MADDSATLRPKAKARRQQILDAACQVVRRAGFHGASMAEIAQAAELSVGQIYRYFENKEAIIAAIVAQDSAEMRAKFAELEASGGGVDAILARCGEALDQNLDLDRAALVLEVMAEAARNPRIAAVVQDADRVERDLGNQLLRNLLGPDCSEAEVAARGEILSMIFDGMFTRAVNHPQADRETVLIVLRKVLRLIFTSPDLNCQINTPEPG